MDDPNTGIYYYCKDEYPGERAFRMESAYYLKYNSEKAIMAIKKIFKNYKGSVSDKCFYYHVYLDLLFSAVGMIITRFRPQKGAGDKLKRQAETNRYEYEFTSQKYPLLNDKSFRNFIEHIDERDEKLIEASEFHGTFNLIYPRMSRKIKESLENDKYRQNNLLNLCTMTYSILEFDKSADAYRVKSINLHELREELLSINKLSEKLFKCLWIERKEPL